MTEKESARSVSSELSVRTSRLTTTLRTDSGYSFSFDRLARFDELGTKSGKAVANFSKTEARSVFRLSGAPAASC